jgi:hypothetical protein
MDMIESHLKMAMQNRDLLSAFSFRTGRRSAVILGCTSDLGLGADAQPRIPSELARETRLRNRSRQHIV